MTNIVDPLDYSDKSTGGEFSRSDADELRRKINEIAKRLGGLNLEGSELVDWNDDFKTINITTGTGSVLQDGQEFYFLIYNDTGSPITNGQIVKPIGGFLVGDFVIPTVILAKADSHATCDGTLFLATSDIADGALGMGTRLGRANDINTDGLTPGADLFLSPTVAGDYTTTRPEFPDYVLGIGGVLFPHATEGQIAVSFQKRVEDTLLNAWDGAMRENFDFLVTSNGSVITGSLERTGGGNLTMIFGDGLSILDTTPAVTIVLTPGTDTVPVMNYVYILKSNKVLAVNTTGWPEPEHIKIADLLLFSASLTQTDKALSNRNWNNHIKVVGDNGHILHIGERIRQLPASWFSGVALSYNLITASTPDDVFVSVTSGFIYQLHKQAFTALNTETGDYVYVRNHNTTPYLKVTNLNVLLEDANGDSLNFTSFSFVLWGISNKSGQINHLMLNLPIGSYAHGFPENALEDASNFANYSIPKEFAGKGFLIARLVLTYFNDAWTVENNVDLRGSFPNNQVGIN